MCKQNWCYFGSELVKLVKQQGAFGPKKNE